MFEKEKNYFKCSVVITTHNSSSYICKAIDSALAQQCVDVEVIVVDDLSQDFERLNSTITTKYAGRPVMVIQPLNKGNANVSRNLGIKRAKFDYIAFLDADDVWNEKHLYEALTDMASQNTDLTINKVCLVKDGKPLDLVQPSYDGDISKYIFNNGIAVTSTIVSKKHTLMQCMFDEKQLKHQDWEFLIRFSDNYKIGQSSYVGLNYTLSQNGNMSSTSNPTATIRFLNNTLPISYHKLMLLSQLYKMIEIQDRKAIFNLKTEININYKFNKKNLGNRALLYPFWFSELGFNTFTIQVFNMIDTSVRALKKLTNYISNNLD